MNTAPMVLCNTATAVAPFNADASLDADDVQQFVLHTSPDSTLGSVIATSAAPSFDFMPGAMSIGTTYYISSLVGNDDGNGNVDMSDPCLDVAVGTPVSWQITPTATMPDNSFVICQGQPVPLIIVNLTGTPPWSLSYSINGVPQVPETVYFSPYPFILGQQLGNAAICLTEIVDTYGCQGPANGCVTVTVPTPIACSNFVSDVNCFGMSDGIIALSCVGGAPSYSYNWSNGATTSTIQNLSPGLYSVTVEDANACTTVNSFLINGPPTPLNCNIFVSGSINCNNPAASLFLGCNGNLPLTYIWTDPNNNIISNIANPTITASGDYSVTVTDANGCSYSSTIVVEGGTQDCGSIIGTVTSEDDGNCTFDPGETALANWMVRATDTNGDEYFDFTDSLGNYSIQAPPGDYVMESIPPAAFWLDCGSPVSLTLEDAFDTDTADFHWLKTINCPLLEVDISTPLLRRCFNNIYNINYCNYGSEPATSAYLEVTLYPLISIISASLPFTGPVNGVYTFGLGDVEPGDCGGFQFVAYVSCDAVLGQTLCAEAHIYPDSICAPIDPTWTGAFLEITSNCTADSVVFTITNTGTGDMTEPQGFIVVEDGVMLMTHEVQLVVGASTTVSYPANGSTYNLLGNQVPGAPGISNPAIFVEGCGTDNAGTFSIGFASQFPEDDAGPFVSIDCQAVIGSYDPNDKRGYPLGYGPDHLIAAGQPLDYHIRFQNTGTDTAFTVVIHDVIAQPLDIATLRPGTSSHPYRLDIHQDTLVFIFENILLPDSNVNEPGSHGFVKFRIGQRAGLPLGTVIENEAAIFFDFNDPIITNQTTHRLGEIFIETAVHKPVLPKKINCTVYPNPFGEEAMVVVQGAENQSVELRLYDLTGRHLRSETIKNGVGKIRKNGLTPGLYFYEITVNGVASGQGKVAVH